MALVLHHREHIEQRLGGVFVDAVACIDHRGVDMLRQQVRRAGHWMANDDDIGAHRVQRAAGIDQRLALLDRGCRRRNVGRSCGHIFRGQLEAHSGAGGVLIEQRHDGFALQMRRLLGGAVQQRAHCRRGGKDGFDLFAFDVAQREQILLLECHAISPLPFVWGLAGAARSNLLRAAAVNLHKGGCLRCREQPCL